MTRPITLFTGQWADLPLEDMCRKASEFGYQGLELACWGDHFEVDKAASDPGYATGKRDLLDRFDLNATRSVRIWWARPCAIGSTGGTARSCRPTCGATGSRTASTSEPRRN